MDPVAPFLSRHGALVASVAFHAAVVAVLIFKLTPPTLTNPANAETPAIAVEVITMPTPTPELVTTAAPPPPPPPEPEPELVEEPPPLIESFLAETVAPPPPPPEVKPEPEKPKPKPVRVRPQPKPAEPAPTPLETAETIAEPAPPTPAPVAQQMSMAAPAGRAGPPPDYLTLLHRALERNKDYPAQARQRRQQGRAMLRFAIDRAGNVLNYKIEKSSGYEVLDREVVAMIQRASPLPPMPADMLQDRLEVVVPIPFVLR